MAFMTTPYVTAETKYGKIRMHAVNGSRVMVDVGDETGHAHINDNRPALTYRGQEYIGSVFFDVTATGISATDVSISRRPEWSSAPKTYAAAMVEAMRETVAAYIAEHPEFLPAAEYADVNNALDSATEKRDKLAAELAEADATVKALAARLTALA